MIAMRIRRGFTLVTVLWVITVAGIAATAAALVGRSAVQSARNRVHMERAQWIAAGCAAEAESMIDARLAQAESFEEAAVVWRRLDQVVPLSSSNAACAVALEAAGTRIDVNAATDEMLSNLLNAMDNDGSPGALRDALLDWLDSDDESRPLGAERAWYVENRRPPPRNAPLADIRELSRVRGFEDATKFVNLLSTEPGRVSLATAPVLVLRAVPGISGEAAERIVELRRSEAPISDLMAIVGQLSIASAESLAMRYPDAVRLTTPDPDAWILTTRASQGLPAGEATIVRRVARVGKRMRVVSSRSE